MKFRCFGGGIDDTRKKLRENIPLEENERDGRGEIVDFYEICFIIIRDSRTKVVLSFTFCFY